MNNKEKIYKLLIEQNRLNTIINKNWKSDRTVDDFKLAILVESGELLDHIGYKWWKHQVMDLKQSQMEVIDIWFFFFSIIVLKEKNLEFVDDMIENSPFFYDEPDVKLSIDNIKNDVIILVNEITNDDISFDQKNMIILSKLSMSLGLTFNDAYKLYMGKLILNIFRQDNGYIEGSYVKIWNGKEDNEVLMTLMDENNDIEIVKSLLKSKYKSILDKIKLDLMRNLVNHNYD